MNAKAAAPGVFALPLYTPAFCRRLLAGANSSSCHWQAAAIDGGADHLQEDAADPAVRSASVIPLGDLPGLEQIFGQSVRQIFTPLVEQAWRIHLPRYADAQIVRYLPGGQYLTHQDRGPGAENRYFTILCYLNDDFTGGATRFPDLDHAEKPRTGKAILFPADYRHCAEPVTSGCKYVLVAWLMGPDPILWI